LLAGTLNYQDFNGKRYVLKTKSIPAKVAIRKEPI